MISRGHSSRKRSANTRTKKYVPKVWHLTRFLFPLCARIFFQNIAPPPPKNLWYPQAYTSQTFQGPPFVKSIMYRPAWIEWNIPTMLHSNRCDSKKALPWILALPYCNVHFWFLAGKPTHDWLRNEFLHGSSRSSWCRSTIARRPAISKDMWAMLVAQQVEVAFMHAHLPKNILQMCIYI